MQDRSFLADRETSNNSQIIDWLKKVSSDLSISRESTPYVHLPRVNTPNWLTDLFKSACKGQMVLAYSVKYGYFDAKNQIIITHCILDSYAANAVKMTYSKMLNRPPTHFYHYDLNNIHKVLKLKKYWHWLYWQLSTK